MIKEKWFHINHKVETAFCSNKVVHKSRRGQKDNCDFVELIKLFGDINSALVLVSISRLSFSVALVFVASLLNVVCEERRHYELKSVVNWSDRSSYVSINFTMVLPFLLSLVFLLLFLVHSIHSFNKL